MRRMRGILMTNVLGLLHARGGVGSRRRRRDACVALALVGVADDAHAVSALGGDLWSKLLADDSGLAACGTLCFA